MLCTSFGTEKNCVMDEKHIVRAQVSIAADRAGVWDALTNPQKTREYFFHCEVHSGWEVGGPIAFRGKVFLIRKIEMTGTILDIEPRHFLKYTLHNDGDYREPSFSTITISLTQDDDGIKVSVTDDVGAGEGADDRYERSIAGWKKVLKGLKEVVEDFATRQ